MHERVILRVRSEPNEVEQRWCLHDVEVAGLQERELGLDVGNDSDVDAIEVRTPGFPVIRVPCETDVVARDPLRECERPGAHRRAFGVWPLESFSIRDIEILQPVKTAGRGWSDLRITVYLSGVSKSVNQFACAFRLTTTVCPPAWGSRTRSMF